MGRPTESLIDSGLCHCYSVWHPVGETDGCIVSIRKRLDPKAVQIISYLSSGLGYREVANLLEISHSTCWYYIEKSQKVLCARGITGLVATALRLGIIY